MPLANVVDTGMVFNASFASTAAQLSAEMTISEAHGACSVFVAPTGVDVAVSIEVQDPLGDWHPALVGAQTTTDGTTDAIPIPLNPGKIRARITPSAGSGSARLWVQAGV